MKRFFVLRFFIDEIFATGHVGWGISWYINGLLIPEINVVRGKTYTFVVEGGNDIDTPAKYHPFYITDDPVGGYEYKTEEEREVSLGHVKICLKNNLKISHPQAIKVFAGIHRARNGKVTPTGVGRICNWTPDQKGPTADEYPSFGAYQRSLTLKCDEGEPGIITWTPDENTPDTVYYQCFTHRYLGWKINVHDSCDNPVEASEREEVFVDAEAEPSVRQETKLFPSENFLQQHEKDLIKHHNMNGAPPSPKITAEMQKNGEFDKLITHGIRAAEALEETLLKERQMNGTKPVSMPTAVHNDATVIGDEKENNATKIIHNVPKPFLRPRRPIPPHLFSSSGMPIFLRPPSGPGFPFYPPGPMPMKLAQRRPIGMEIRTVSRKPVSPYLLPQQSMVVNHYKRPNGLPPHSHGPPPMGIRNYMKSKSPPVPPKPMAPVLLLGEPTEIKPTYKKSSSDVVIGKPSKTQVEISPMIKQKLQKTPPRPPHKYPMKKNEKPILQHSPRSPFKDPFDMKKEVMPYDDVPNTGFKEDTIIVESGFRPIFRREDVKKPDDSMEESDGERISASIPSISRRSDDFVDSDEYVGELLTNEEPQKQFFEPMFIPSPRDSIALPLVNDTQEETSDDDTMVAEASERQEFFYLPPNESKRSVVAYDAKAVLDTSLLNDPLPSQNDFVKLSSKTKQFIKDTPQFAPFTGEIPSDLREMLLQSSGSSGSSRSSSSSSPSVVSKDRTSSISTKLSAVKTNDGTRR